VLIINIFFCFEQYESILEDSVEMRLRRGTGIAMDIESYRKRIDIVITVFIACFFVICMSFQYIGIKESFENYIMLTLAMIVALISYYTNITISLISVLVVDFVYSSYNLYKNIAKGISIDGKVYYWIIIIPIIAVVVSAMAKYILELQIQSKNIYESNKNLVMIDELTGIRNYSALFNEIPIYMSMGKRYNIPVSLMLVKFKYSRKLKSIIGKHFFKDIIVKSSEIFGNSLRLEDRKYILNDEDAFAFLLICDKKGCEIVKKRFKENIEKINLEKDSVFKGLKVEVEIGYQVYNENVKDVMDFINKAEMETHYDV